MAAERIIKKGSTDVFLSVAMRASATGALKGSIAYTAPTVEYQRDGSATKVTLELVDGTLGTHVDDSWKETQIAGVYQLCLPDAAFLTGANGVVVTVTSADALDKTISVALVGIDVQDAVRGGMTALPNAAADAAGGLIISDAGGLDADDLKADVTAILEDTGTTLDTLIKDIPTVSEFNDRTLLAAGYATPLNITQASGITLANDAITAAKIAADAVTELQSGLATAAALATVDGIVDTMTAKLIGTIATGTHNPQSGDAYARLGAAGASLSAVPWNAAWDEQVQSECKDALDAYDPPTNTEFELRTLPKDDYVVVTDTLAAVTTVTTTTSVTNGVTLANDAITAAKFDESTAFPLKSADTGATAVARTGADADTLKTLSDEIASASPPAASAIADAVWNETLTDHLGVGATGTALNAAGSAGDPWSTALPGEYGAGTAGKIIGTNLDATVGTRSTLSAAQVNAEVDTALADYDPPTKAELDSGLAALNDLSSVESQAAAAAAITAAGLATATALDAVDNYVDTEVAAIKVVTDKLATAIELDGAVYRLTANALELAPSPEVTLSPEDIAAIAAGITIDPQDIRDAMKLAPTTGAAATGSVDAHLDAIELKTATIGSVTVTAVSPIVAGEELDIVSGGDHTSTRAFTFTYTGHDLTTVGTTARIRFISGSAYSMGTEASVLQVAATITTVSTTAGSIAVSMTAAQTDVLQPSVHPRNYRYQLQIVPAAGDPWMLAQGWANVSLFHSAVPA